MVTDGWHREYGRHWHPLSLVARRPGLATQFPIVYEVEDRSCVRTARRLEISRTSAVRLRNRLGLPPGPAGSEITGLRKRNRRALELA